MAITGFGEEHKLYDDFLSLVSEHGKDLEYVLGHVSPDNSSLAVGYMDKRGYSEVGKLNLNQNIPVQRFVNEQIESVRSQGYKISNDREELLRGKKGNAQNWRGASLGNLVAVIAVINAAEKENQQRKSMD